MINWTATSSSSGRSSSSRDELLQGLTNGRITWNELGKQAQEQVVEAFVQKVKIVASRMKAKVPRHVDINDLLSAGSLGLVESLRSFDPSIGVKLETHVENRIRGAMLDELRRQDWFSRGLRQHIRLVERAVRDLEQKTGRDPSEEEIREQTGLTAKEVSQALEALQVQVCCALDNFEQSLADERSNGPGGEPYAVVLKGELTAQVGRLIEELTQREQYVLSLYYREELTMKETAEVMDITEGRVSQLHQQALDKLRRKLRQAEN